MSEYFPESKCLGANVKIELDLSNYATKADLKNAKVVYISKFTKKVDLACLNVKFINQMLINQRKYQLVQTI